MSVSSALFVDSGVADFRSSMVRTSFLNMDLVRSYRVLFLISLFWAGWRSGAESRFQPVEPVRMGFAQSNPVQPADTRSLQSLLNGWGIAVGDLNEDGWPDLILGGPPGWGGVYLSQGKPWSFTNQIARCSPRLQQATIAGALVCDLDQDGHPDLVTSTYDHGIQVHFNRGQAQWKASVWDAHPLKDEYWGSLAAADINNDGRVEIVAGGYRQRRAGAEMNGIRVAAGVDRRVLPGPGMSALDPDRFRIGSDGLMAEMGAQSVLLLNQGGGNLLLKPLASVGDYGSSQERALTLDWTLGCAFQDVNLDGYPDLYLCNDFHSPDRLWINRGDGTFTNRLTDSVPFTSLFSMGIGFTDLNGDRLPDWLVTDMLPRSGRQQLVEFGNMYEKAKPSQVFGPLPQVSRNTLFISQGSQNQWREMACLKGVAASGWSWGPVWIDLDGDGHQDLLIPSGYAQNLQDRSRPKDADPDAWFPSRENGVTAFLQRPDGRFIEGTQSLGLGSCTNITMAVIACDLDHDGDADLVVHNFNRPIQVFENTTTQPSVCLALKTQQGGQPIEGTRVVWTSGTQAAAAQWFGGGTYLSSPPPEFFATLSTGADAVGVEITWPDGQTQSLNLKPGWHTLSAPFRKSRDVTSVPKVNVGSPEEGKPFRRIQQSVLKGTSGDSVDDLPFQPALPSSLVQDRFVAVVRDSQVWVGEPTGGSLLRLSSTDSPQTPWRCDTVVPRLSSGVAAFLPGSSVAWLEGTYVPGSSGNAQLFQWSTAGTQQVLGRLPTDGLSFVAGPAGGPWLLGGITSFGRFPAAVKPFWFLPDSTQAVAVQGWDPAVRLSDGIWIADSATPKGIWFASEWVGDLWFSKDPSPTSSWTRVTSAKGVRAPGYLQRRLFHGFRATPPQLPEILVSGWGLNHEVQVRSHGEVLWAMPSGSVGSIPEGVVEMTGSNPLEAHGLLPLTQHLSYPDSPSFTNVLTYASAVGVQLHPRARSALSVGMANTRVVRNSQGGFERRELPLELQVAPLCDALVVPTPTGPAWLVTFEETEGHRSYPSPRQKWPAMLYWPDHPKNPCLPASALGFLGLHGAAQIVAVEVPGSRGFHYLALWKNGRSFAVYEQSR